MSSAVSLVKSGTNYGLIYDLDVARWYYKFDELRVEHPHLGGEAVRVELGGKVRDARFTTWKMTYKGTSYGDVEVHIVPRGGRAARITYEGKDYEVHRVFFTLGDKAFDVPVVELDINGRPVVVRVIKLTIDDRTIEVPEFKPFFDQAAKHIVLRPTTIYDAAAELEPVLKDAARDKDPHLDEAGATMVTMLGTEVPSIPILCHREHMHPVAVCRVCSVEVDKNPRLVPACQAQVQDGTSVATSRNNRRVRHAVRTLLELLMADHPSPCEKQKKTMDCELERLSLQFQAQPERFPRRPAEVLPHDDSSLVIKVDHNACILCDRCVRACDDIRENLVIGRMNKGYESRIAFDLDTPMGNSTCVACGECMISCPTGALTNRQIVEAKPWAGIKPKPGPVTADELLDHPLEEIREAFAGVSRPFLRWNEHAIVRRHFKKGDIICKEGEFGSTAFLIESGNVEIFINAQRKHAKARKNWARGDRVWGGLFGLAHRFSVGLVARDQDDREEESTRAYIPVDAPVSLPYGNPIATLGPGNIFGEMTCMNHYPRSATVRAAEDCTVLELLRNVLYIMQRSKSFRAVLERTYRERAIATHLKSVPIFESLRADPAVFERFVDELRDKVQLVRRDPGEIIFRQGSVADDGFYLVRTGFVKVTQNRPGGDRVLSYIGPGGYFGEIGLMSHLPEIQGLAPAGVRTATCSALDHVDLVQITADDFRRLLDRFPQIREPLVREAAKRLEANERELRKAQSVPLGDFLNQGLFEANSLLVLDLQKCTRCDECTKACSDAHEGVTRLIREGLRFDKFLVASSCRSCLDPYCMVGCPVGSIRRRESLEIIIEDWCIGCGKCAENCPYGNINMHGIETGETMVDPTTKQTMAVVQQKATACDLCHDLGGEPSCVYACPHDAAHRMTGRELLDLVQQGHSS